MSKGVASVRKLHILVQVCPRQVACEISYNNRNQTQGNTILPFTQLVYDAYRFSMHNRQVIENNPRQTYASALLFSPNQSLVKKLFRHEEPKGITIKPEMMDEWSACLQTLEGHMDYVISMAFSHDSTRVTSVSTDGIVKIWDTSGACLHTFKNDGYYIGSAAFSHDLTWLALAYEDTTVKL